METEIRALSRASNRLKALYGVVSATHGDEGTLDALKLSIKLIDTVIYYTTENIKEENEDG